MSLRNFIEDVYDQPLSEIDIPTIINLKTKELCYNSLFKNKRVVDSVIFCHVWSACFGVHPTVYEIRQAHKEINSMTLTNILIWMSKNSFCKYMPDLVQYKELTIKKSLENVDIKHGLLLKLSNRYDYPITTSASLFKTYTMMDREIIKGSPSFINTVTGFELQTNYPESYNNVSLPDQIQYNVLADHYFMRTIMKRDTVFLYGDAPDELLEGILDALQKPVVLFSTVRKDIKNCKNICVNCTKLYKYVPNIGKTCIIIDLNNIRSGRIPKSVLDQNDIIASADECECSNKIRCFTKTVPKSEYRNWLYIGEDPVLKSREYIKHYITQYFMSQQDNRYYTALGFLAKLYLKKKAESRKSANDAKHAVLLIDNRANQMSVISVIISMSYLKQEDWQLIIVTKSENQPFYKKLLKDYNPIFKTHQLQYKEPFDIEDYNLLLKDSSFWREFTAFDRLLLIQDDGLLVRSGIEDFMVYDYIGAPWNPGHHENTVLDKVCNPQLVGNGGFSLRSSRTMLEISSVFEKEKSLLFNNDLSPIPEDVYFAKMVYKHGYKLPTHVKAQMFASEELLNNSSIGLHKVWHYHPVEKVMSLYESILDK